jgi:esterase
MELNYKTFGHGPALIILHGLLGSLDNWVTLARRLGETYSVFVVDQRNHGKSPHRDTFTYPILAEDLMEFMDQQRIYQAHVLGHSMGGKTAMQFAGLHPERLDKLIVADMAPKAYKPHHNEIFDALRSVDLPRLQSRQEAEELLKVGVPDPPIRQFLMKSLTRDKEHGYRWKFNLPVLYKSYPDILAEVALDMPFDKPTLFLSGGDSPYVAPADHERILRDFPEAHFEVIPGTGHWLHAEAPGVFLEKVQNFLAGT